MFSNLPVHRLPQTVIDGCVVSTVAMPDRDSFDSLGVPMPRWETVVFYPANHYGTEGANSTDPIQHPCHRRHTMLNDYNGQLATIAHEIVCYRLRAGIKAWEASDVSKDDIKRVIRMSADD